MMKFFRKYTKQLLAVFMGLLLVIWLAGDALTSLLDTSRQEMNAPRGEIFGKPVKLTDMLPAFSELKVLDALNVPWQRVWRFPARMFSPSEDYLDKNEMEIRDWQKHPLTEDEWYMLDSEARQRQVSVPQEVVERFKQAQGGEARLASIRFQHSLATKQVDEAIRSFVRVLESVSQTGEGVKISEADIQDFVRQTREKARVDLVFLDSSKFVDKTYKPTEQEMKELFVRGKDRDPVDGSMTEFGYRLPERVQVEYIQVNAAELANRLPNPTDDDAFSYWSDHKSEFLKPSTQPASGPATSQPEERQPYGTFTEARSQVLEMLKAYRAREESLRLARDMIARLGRAWSDAPTTQPGGYKQPPESEKNAQTYPDLVKLMQGRYPGVLKYARTALTDAMGLMVNLEIGWSMAFANTSRPVSFGRVAFMVCGLEANREANPDHARLFRNVYETCSEPLVDRQNNAYVFRNVAAAPRQAPSSWQEVGKQLVEDVWKMRAHAEAGRQTKALADRAAKAGLRMAFDADAALKAKPEEAVYLTPEPFARKVNWQIELMPNAIRDVGGGAELMTLCFALAGKTAQAERVKAHELVGGRGWVVIEGEEIVPVTRADYDEQRFMATAILTIKRQIEFLKNWFAPEQIRQRVGWKEPPQERAKPAEKESATKPATGEKGPATLPATLPAATTTAPAPRPVTSK